MVETETENERRLHEASEWIIRMSDNASEREEHSLREWLEAHPDNERAYHTLQRLWNELPAVDADTRYSALAASGNEQPVAVNDDELAGPTPWRRKLLSWTAGFAAAAAIAFAVLPGLPLFAPEPPVRASERYSTAIAQISKIRLADGSQVTLGPKSAVAVTFSDHARDVQLLHGEAFFDVTHDAHRPFVVDAGLSTVRVLGTSFNVSREHASVEVGVVRGIVQVRDRQDGKHASHSTTLRRGDLVRVADHGDGTRQFLKEPGGLGASIRGMRAGGWRNGWLAYDNAPLSDIVKDLNRYYKPGIAMHDLRATEIRVTASFRVEQISAFVRSMERLFPVAVSEQESGELSIGPPH